MFRGLRRLQSTQLAVRIRAHRGEPWEGEVPYMAKQTTVSETPAADFVAGLSERYLHCRELGHTWKPLTVSYDKSARVFDRRIRCSVCRTERKMLVGMRGDIVSSSYNYAEGYLAQHVEPGVLSRRDFRLEAITRMLRPESDAPKTSRRLKAVS